jgi:hypothetical protein
MQDISIADAEETALWFIKHMSMQQRRALMAERPLLYARLFPRAASGPILASVRFELNQLREE